MIGSILLICSVLLIQNCTKPLPSGQVILQNSPHTGNYTGEEDYFLGSYAYEPIDSTGRNKGFTNFNTLYSGFYQAFGHRLFGQYHWNVLDLESHSSEFKIE